MTIPYDNMKFDKICCTAGELFIITELLENGSLKDFFQKNRDSFVDVINPKNALSKSKANIYEYEGSPTTRSVRNPHVMLYNMKNLVREFFKRFILDYGL